MSLVHEYLIEHYRAYGKKARKLLPVSADDDFSSFTLALDLDPEPLPVFDLGRDRRVQLRQGPVVDPEVPGRDVGRPHPVRHHLDTVLEKN